MLISKLEQYYACNFCGEKIGAPFESFRETPHDNPKDFIEFKVIPYANRMMSGSHTCSYCAAAAMKRWLVKTGHMNYSEVTNES